MRRGMKNLTHKTQRAILNALCDQKLCAAKRPNQEQSYGSSGSTRAQLGKREGKTSTARKVFKRNLRARRIVAFDVTNLELFRGPFFRFRVEDFTLGQKSGVYDDVVLQNVSQILHSVATRRVAGELERNSFWHCVAIMLCSHYRFCAGFNLFWSKLQLERKN